MERSREQGWHVLPPDLHRVFLWLSAEAASEGSAAWLASSPVLRWPHGRWALQQCRDLVAEHRAELMRLRMEERRRG